MTKNICIVSSYFAPAWAYGGPPKVLYTLAEELIRQKKLVKVITTDALDKNRNIKLKENMHGIDIFRFATSSNALAFKMKLFIVPGLLSQTKEILSGTDFVLFSDVRSLFNRSLYKYVYSQKIPYGIFAFGNIPLGEGSKAIVKNIFDRLWVKDFVKRATLRFAQTVHEQEMFNRFYNIPLAQTQFLPLPVVQKQVVFNQKKLNDFKDRWEIKTDNRVILYVGRLHYLKGVDILIKSLIPLLKNNSSLKLMIVGWDDGEEKHLKNLVPHELKNKIIFTGPLYNEDVIDAYYCAACFVITPRYFEETSAASLEALSYGVPVVTTNEADIPYLEKYHAGYVIKNDINIIAQAVNQILDMKSEEINSIKMQAKKLIADNYSSENVTKKLLTYIEK